MAYVSVKRNIMRAGRFRTPIVVGILCVFIALAYFACAPTKLNYQLTLEVDADGVIHTGSSVIGTDWSWTAKSLQGFSSTAFSTHVHGEAVMVDLGSRGLLFALLTGPAHPYGTELPFNLFDPLGILLAFPAAASRGFEPDAIMALSRTHDAVDVPADRLPMLVRFTDIANPHSVTIVDPANLAASFGAGVRLARARLKITRDPVTRDLATKVSWASSLDDIRDQYCCSGSGATANLKASNFSR